MPDEVDAAIAELARQLAGHNRLHLSPDLEVIIAQIIYANPGEADSIVAELAQQLADASPDDAEAIIAHFARDLTAPPGWWQLVGMAIMLPPLWLAYGQPTWARLAVVGVGFLALLFGMLWAVSGCLGELDYGAQ